MAEEEDEKEASSNYSGTNRRTETAFCLEDDDQESDESSEKEAEPPRKRTRASEAHPHQRKALPEKKKLKYMAFFEAHQLNILVDGTTSVDPVHTLDNWFQTYLGLH